MRYLVKAQYVNYLMLMDYELDSLIRITYLDENSWTCATCISTDMKHLYEHLAKLKSKGTDYCIEKDGVTFEKWMMLI